MRTNRPLVTLGLVTLATIASLVPALAVAAQPRSPFAVAAVFPPWWSAERVYSAASAAGTVSRTGRWNIVVVYGGTDVGRLLGRNGAWAIIDPELADCANQRSVK